MVTACCIAGTIREETVIGEILTPGIRIMAFAFSKDKV